MDPSQPQPQTIAEPAVRGRLPRSAFAGRLREFPGLVFVEAAAQRGRWGAHFRERIGPAFDGRIIFEVGCFDGTLLGKVAAKHSNAAFVGLDWKAKAIHDAAGRMTALGLRNVALVRGRGQDVAQVFGPREVDEVWVFHPDPFAGPGELKNRLVSEPFLLDVYATLRDGGASSVVLKTDHAGYFQWALALFGLPEPDAFRAAREGGPSAGRAGPRVRDLMRPEEIPAASEMLRQRFRVVAHSADFWNDPALLARTAGRCFAGEVTGFEARFVSKRWPIYYLEVAKT